MMQNNQTSLLGNARMGRSLPPLAQITFTLTRYLMTWEMRRRTRCSLKHLDDHLLKDIGLRRDEARHESSLPFWRV